MQQIQGCWWRLPRFGQWTPVSSLRSLRCVQSTNQMRPTDGYRFFMRVHDGFEHKLNYLYFYMEQDAGKFVSDEELVTLQRREGAIFEVRRLFSGNDGVINGAKCVFMFRFQINKWFCALLSAPRIGRGYKYFRPWLASLTEEALRIYHSGCDCNMWDACFTDLYCRIC